MSLDPYSPTRFVKGNTCLPCCAGGVSECGCVQFVPFGSFPPVPYSDYVTAAAALASGARDCIVFDAGTPATLTAAFDGTTLAIINNGELPGYTNTIGISMKAGGVLSLDFTFSTDGTVAPIPVYGVLASLVKCDYSGSAGSDNSQAGSGTLTLTAPDDGQYILLLGAGSGIFPPATFLNTTWSITCSSTFTVLPVVATYDDSGTTRQLEACPKMLIPPQTEITGDWYASCADAEDAITTSVIDCYDYLTIPVPVPDVGSIVYNFSGTTISAVGSSLEDSDGSLNDNYFSVNLVGGDTAHIACAISLSVSYTGGTFTAANANAAVELLELDGNPLLQVDDPQSSPGSGSIASSASGSVVVPYTGRYLVHSFAGASVLNSPGDDPIASYAASASCTSSGAISANPIQALYDVTLDCPARLNCGDSC